MWSLLLGRLSFYVWFVVVDNGLNKLAHVQLNFDLPYLDLYFMSRKKMRKNFFKKIKIRYWKLKKEFHSLLILSKFHGSHDAVRLFITFVVMY